MASFHLMTQSNSKDIFKSNWIIFKSLKVLLLLILMVNQSCESEATCPSTSSSFPVITIQKDTITDGISGSTHVEIKKLATGPISNNLYILYKVTLTPTNLLVVRKQDISGNQLWMTSIAISNTITTISVDKNEENVYISFKNGGTNPFVSRLRASDGAILSTQYYTNLKEMRNYSRVYPLSDNSGYYYVAMPNTGITPVMCRYLFLTSSNYECQDISLFKNIVNTQQFQNSDVLYLVGINTSNNPIFYKIKFGNTVAEWANKIDCSSFTCLTHPSESIIDEDNNLIYNFFLYGPLNAWKIYFVTFNATNGNVVGTRFRSSNLFGDISQLVMYENIENSNI